MTDFQDSMEKHLIKFKSDVQYLPPASKLYHDMSDNLFPPIKHGFLQYAYNSGMPLHNYVNHVRSSQIFCVNLFFHLIQYEKCVLLSVLSKQIGVALVELMHFKFEFSADKNVLGEWKSNDNCPEEYVTATDLYIKAKDNQNKYGY